MRPRALNLFYREPFEATRWLSQSRASRQVLRWFGIRNRLSGFRQLTRQLRLGLERAGLESRFNDFRHADRHPDEPIGVLGKTSLLARWTPANPVVFGPCMLDHPRDVPDLLDRFDARAYLVPSAWVREMFAPFFGNRVVIWPVGIDLERWRDFSEERKTVDFLVYEKFLWGREEKLKTVLGPILERLDRLGFATNLLHCGAYTHAEYEERLRRSRWMIFLCEHETQGQAYQQALACNVPVLAWDQGRWLDPKASRYGREPVPASSVPWFSEACGMTFRACEDFPARLDDFIANQSGYSPRQFVSSRLDLVESARRYADILARAGPSARPSGPAGREERDPVRAPLTPGRERGSTTAGGKGETTRAEPGP